MMAAGMALEYVLSFGSEGYAVSSGGQLVVHH